MVEGDRSGGVTGLRKVGRPRKWATEADRKRAYRERLAADLDEPLALRRELRTERRRTAGLQQENHRLRTRLAAAEHKAETAEEAGRRAEDRLASLRNAADRDRRQLLDALARLAEMEAKIEELRAPPQQPAIRSPEARRTGSPGLPLPSRDQAARRCFSVGCGLPATCRVQGPRGVERDACDGHARPERRPGRWRVVRRYE
jgi:hypothetical protein